MRRTDAEFGVEVCSSTSYFRGIINSATTYSLLDGRIYVAENAAKDLKTVHGYQDELTAVLRNRTSSTDDATNVPELSLDLLTVNNRTLPSAVERHLELLARLAPYNQPLAYNDRWRVASILGASGIYGGHYHPLFGVNLTAAQRKANATIQSASLDPSNYIDLGREWYADALDIAGDFGTDYAYRAFSATELFLEIVPSQALYPRPRVYYNTGFALPAGRSLLFTFSGVPPIGPRGFWSLTAYSENFTLVPNALGRYELGSRQKLTYEDGLHGYPVVGGEEGDAATKPFQLLLQAADEVPPYNWTDKYV